MFTLFKITTVVVYIFLFSMIGYSINGLNGVWTVIGFSFLLIWGYFALYEVSPWPDPPHHHRGVQRWPPMQEVARSYPYTDKPVYTHTVPMPVPEDDEYGK